MNKTRALELLPIIQAFAEGKVIQFKNQCGSNWNDLQSDPSFTEGVSYRIKPEPIYRWLPVFADMAAHCTYPTYECAARSTACGKPPISILKIELVEGVFQQ